MGGGGVYVLTGIGAIPANGSAMAVGLGGEGGNPGADPGAGAEGGA